jgi:hypothetical protein
VGLRLGRFVGIKVGRGHRRRGLKGIIHRSIQEGKYAQRGQYIDQRGYARYKDTNKLVHRHVAEKYIVHRQLRSDEDVHHINRNKLDNRIENLRVLNHDDHMLHHALHGEHTGSYILSKIIGGKKRY